MPAATKTDLIDFVDAMTTLNPAIGAYAKECIERGADPRTVANGLETAAKEARGWCAGRFGDATTGLHSAIKNVSFTPAVTPAGEHLSDRTEDAYSAGRYGRKEWAKCATLLLQRGYSEREAEAILRSKWTRWAGDMASTDTPTADDLARYLDNPRSQCTKEAVQELVDQTL